MTGDRVLPLTRAVAALVACFLAIAWAILWGFPARTGEWWSWPISPELTPLVLGGAYGAGAYLFVRLALTERWHRVGIALPGIAVFAALVGIATIVHWDRFTHGSLAFWLWAALYVTTPVVVPVVWLRNRRTDDGAPDADDVRVPHAARRVAGGFALGALGVGAACFLSVDAANWLWPWQLTPLTGKVIGALLVENGVLAVMLARERRWSGWRVPVQVNALFFLLAGIGVVRDRGSFERGWAAAAWLMLAVAALGALVAVYATCERRRWRQRPEDRLRQPRPDALAEHG